MKKEQVFAVCAFIKNDDGKILSVSRKNDPNDIGLPGGKIDQNEEPKDAVLRELLEETGYIADPEHTHLIYSYQINGHITETYEVPYHAIKKIREPVEQGIVSWVCYDVLANGKTFGEYNRGLLKHRGLLK